MARKKSTPTGPSLLEAAARQGRADGPPAPLADRMRPGSLEDVVGQRHLLAEGRFLARAIERDQVPSLLLWGPPGTGKTTLAHVVSRLTRSEFVPFNAVLGGVAELRQIIAEARERRTYRGTRTLLFVDEIHRFNRSQQDAFLPHVESGTVTLIGATTENPSFSVNAAVLSRCKVFRLQALETEDLLRVLQRALVDPERGLGKLPTRAEPAALERIAESARGDARCALGMLETVVTLLQSEADPPASADAPLELDLAAVERGVEQGTLLYDKSGEEHYNVVSALIKSLRGSDPDAAIYYLMRMLDAGDDPLFVLRRLIIFASEDVGNADPRALSVVVDADAAYRRIGMPEGLYPIAHACLYLACCPKSGAVGRAFQAARAAIERHGALPVPLKLRNAATALMKREGYGQGYRSAHDHGGYVPGETYLPERLQGAHFYQPTSDGLEKAIGERLARLRGAGGAQPPDPSPSVVAPASPAGPAPATPAAGTRTGDPRSPDTPSTSGEAPATDGGTPAAEGATRTDDPPATQVREVDG